MEFLSYIYHYLDLYILIWGRIVGFFMTTIPFNNRNFPSLLRVWLAALISFLVLMVYPNNAVQISNNLFGYFIQFLGEVLIGAILGFLTQLVFSTFQFAGQIIDMQIGFGIVNVIDPQSGVQLPVLGNFKYILALIFFLTINGHHLLIQSLFRSYYLLPVGNLHLSGTFYSFIFSLVGEMFSSAFKIALPMLGALFIADLALAIIARTVPQMNVFIVGMPLKIGIGLFLLMILLPLFIWMFSQVFTGLIDDLNKLLLILRR